MLKSRLLIIEVNGIIIDLPRNFLKSCVVSPGKFQKVQQKNILPSLDVIMLVVVDTKIFCQDDAEEQTILTLFTRGAKKSDWEIVGSP